MLDLTNKAWLYLLLVLLFLPKVHNYNSTSDQDLKIRDGSFLGWLVFVNAMFGCSVVTIVILLLCSQGLYTTVLIHRSFTAQSIHTTFLFDWIEIDWSGINYDCYVTHVEMVGSDGEGMNPWAVSLQRQRVDTNFLLLSIGQRSVSTSRHLLTKLNAQRSPTL